MSPRNESRLSNPIIIQVVIFGCLVALPCVVLHADFPSSLLKKEAVWYSSPEAIQIGEIVISYQSPSGGFPKNTPTTKKPFEGDKEDLQSTFDNKATTDELRFLARLFEATCDDRYRVAFEKGFEHILIAQYPTGGWPQRYPVSNSYHRHITFNDQAMVRVMEFLDELPRLDRYAFLGHRKLERAKQAFDRGVECILKCQIVVDGKRTVWCAQHDEIDYRPRAARAFEPVSLSSAESTGIVLLLQKLERKSDEVEEAIKSAKDWFRLTQLEGTASGKSSGRWARFYEIGTNRPVFGDRDGKVHYDISQISAERRNGYSWYGNWPQKVLESKAK